MAQVALLVSLIAPPAGFLLGDLSRKESGATQPRARRLAVCAMITSALAGSAYAVAAILYFHLAPMLATHPVGPLHLITLLP